MRFLFGYYVTFLHLQVTLISTYFIQRKKKKKKRSYPSSSYSKARNVFNLPQIVKNNVEK